MKKVTLENQVITAYDVFSLDDLQPEQYSRYLEELLYLDHNERLISGIAGYPIAVKKEQVDVLVSYLQQLKNQMK